MSIASALPFEESNRGRPLPATLSVLTDADSPQSHACAVSWGAIFAGAAAAAALSLILLMLGTGLGLSSISPWSRSGVNASTLGIATILWVTLTQLVASAMGGYLAGRLRTRWIGAHADEIYFRDTAHGFLSWAVASLATAALLTSVIGGIVNGGVQAGASVIGSVGSSVLSMAKDGGAISGAEPGEGGSNVGPLAYFIDSLFRKSPTSIATQPNALGDAPSSEIARIFMSTIKSGSLAAEDVQYVGQIVAQRTGLTQQEAEQRVSATYTRMQARLRDTETSALQAADKARKASAYAALWLFISLLVGAFFASLSATYGGRRRDS
jgi:hypothetical protein